MLASSCSRHWGWWHLFDAGCECGAPCKRCPWTAELHQEPFVCAAGSCHLRSGYLCSGVVGPSGSSYHSELPFVRLFGCESLKFLAAACLHVPVYRLRIICRIQIGV